MLLDGVILLIDPGGAGPGEEERRIASSPSLAHGMSVEWWQAER